MQDPRAGPDRTETLRLRLLGSMSTDGAESSRLGSRLDIDAAAELAAEPYHERGCGR